MFSCLYSSIFLWCLLIWLNFTYLKVTEGVSGQGGFSGHTADFLLFSNLLLTRLQPRRARRWGMCMDLPQLGPVAVLLLKNRKSGACPETPLSGNPIRYLTLVLDHTTCSPQVHKGVRFWQEGANSPPKWSPVYMYMYVILHSRQWNNILESILSYVLTKTKTLSCVNSELLSQLKPVYLNLVSWLACTRLPPRNSLVNEVEFLGLITQKR